MREWGCEGVRESFRAAKTTFWKWFLLALVCSLCILISAKSFSRPSDQLKCPRFSRHAVYLGQKVEVISAEGYLFQWPLHLFQLIPCISSHAAISFSRPSDQLKCPTFSRHAVYLGQKVEVISAEGYLFQWPRHLFQRICAPLSSPFNSSQCAILMWVSEWMSQKVRKWENEGVREWGSLLEKNEGPGI